MSDANQQPTNLPVAVIGAGPAGIYAARQLAAAGCQVALLNRDLKPGGLAEYGIYYDKYKMKDGLRKQFRQILSDERIRYYGGVTVGSGGALSLDSLRKMGFSAVLVSVGAQGTKWLGLPGEQLTGVYHAKDLVYHYNKLPPFSQEQYAIGQRVALIGVGNVMMDIAHWLVRDLRVEEVIAVARRGPAEVKFTKAEMEIIGANLDLTALDAELERYRPLMESIGQNVETARNYIIAGLAKAQPPVSQTRFRFDFLASPTRILGEDKVAGLEVEETTLLLKDDGDTRAKGLGKHRILPVDTVIFCIGDRVDEEFGLPFEWNEFVKHPQPRYPQDGVSYEAYDPASQQGIEGVFVAGWSRKASDGLVGVARKDGETGAKAVLAYLHEHPSDDAAIQRLEAALNAQGILPVRQADLLRLEAAERAIAAERGLPEFKFSNNEEMLTAMGLSMQPAGD